MSDKKAYDFKDLSTKLKSRGLDVAEDAARELTEAVLEWFKESAIISKNPYDDMALVVLPKIEEIIFQKIDQIDGKEG